MSIESHVATIVSLAGQADTLIEQLRPILNQIEVEESALHREAIVAGLDACDHIAGRRRLAYYAQGRCFKPQWSQTVAQVANKAWEEYL